jgi:hypothetical protein
MKNIDNTIHEEMLDGATRKLRQEYRLIRTELSTYSWKTIQMFSKIFPCSDPNKFPLEVCSKEYLEEQEAIKDKIRTTNSFVTEFYSTEHIYISSVEDFWLRWNKFKNLKAFL